MKRPLPKPRKEVTQPQAVPVDHFGEVVTMIQESRQRALQTVNVELIDLYWRIGEYISRKIETAAWGEGVVDQLATYIADRHPDIKGFNRRNLFRMRQFFETYRNDKKVSPLVRQLPWTHNLLIVGRCKRAEEREFYLRVCAREGWGKRELERQLAGALFERAVLYRPSSPTNDCFSGNCMSFISWHFLTKPFCTPGWPRFRRTSSSYRA